MSILNRTLAIIRRRLALPIAVTRATMRHFAAARGSEAASSIAFYALFSLFPLFLVLVVIGSLFLQDPQAFDVAIHLLGQVIPVSQSVIQEIVSGVLQERETMTVIGLLGLVFSASSLFSSVAVNINRAWPRARQCSFLTRQLIAVSIVGLVVLILVLSILVRIVLALIMLSGLLPQSQLPVFAGWFVTGISDVWRWILACLVFLALYRWVPRIRVPWRSALWAALVAGSAWQLAATLFTWYMGTGLARLDLVYGSLGAIIALMLWFYLTALVLLFGAHLSAAIAGQGGSLTPPPLTCDPSMPPMAARARNRRSRERALAVTQDKEPG